MLMPDKSLRPMPDGAGMSAFATSLFRRGFKFHPSSLSRAPWAALFDSGALDILYERHSPAPLFVRLCELCNLCVRMIPCAGSISHLAQ